MNHFSLTNSSGHRSNSIWIGILGNRVLFYSEEETLRLPVELIEVIETECSINKNEKRFIEARLERLNNYGIGNRRNVYQR